MHTSYKILSDMSGKKRIKGKRQKDNKKKDKKHSSEEVPEEDENYPKPRTFVKGAKEKLIAKGSRAGRHEYQTMDDVVSDWGSENENKENRSQEQADAQSKDDRSKLAKSKDIVEERSKVDRNNKELSKAQG
uniref:HABP4_PAI-RBP1 domain-containing protein n=1 Tax=Ascaris lumbricoides TaxID=6252 RepID=A0A0M3IU93_ASCLU